jgi:hypothetical protein
MDAPAAELSSIATVLGDLIRRVAAIAEECNRSRREDVASDLLAVEGLLETAKRRLDKVVEGPRPG